MILRLPALLLALVATLLPRLAAAADKPLYAPPAAWVKPLAIPKASPEGQGATEVLLQDSQIRFGPDGDEFYDEVAVRIAAPSGLSQVGNISEVWQPDTETLVIHKLRVIRDGKVIDLLADGKTFTVLRREANLEMAMLDGSLTATFQPEGLQVGDVLDWSFTRIRKDPLWRGRSEGQTEMFSQRRIERFHLAAQWSADKPIHWKAGVGYESPQTGSAPGVRTLGVDRTAFEAPRPPMGAPSRFWRQNRISFSQFSDWAEAAALMAPLYDRAATLPADSPLKAEIARIAQASKDPKARATAALKLVEQDVRYLLLGMNLGGYLPADADETWRRRFGDCKGKTVLLLALLRGLGIEAEPTLISTTGGDALPEELPRLRLFDHVMVRATIDGRVYWLDGTRQGDRNLDDLEPPPFRWALPLRSKDARLIEIAVPPLAAPRETNLTTLDLRAGLDAPAPTHAEILFRGDQALGLHLGFMALTQSDLDRRLREGFQKTYPWLTIAKVDSAWDEATGQLRISMDGAGPPPWSRFSGGRQLHLMGSQLGGSVSFERQPGPDADAPIAVRHPSYTETRLTVLLPDRGAGFALGGGGDVDETLAGRTLHRRTRLDGGTVTMETSTRSLGFEFPFAHASADAEALRTLGLTDVWITARTGGAVLGSLGPSSFAPPLRLRAPSPSFDSGPPAVDPQSLPEPIDWQDHMRRAWAWREAGVRDKAFADLDAAVRLAPEDPRPRLARARLRLEAGSTAAAREDLDAAVRLQPDLAQARLERGRLALAAGDPAAAIAEFDRAAADAPHDPSVMAAAAEALAGARAWRPALDWVDRALAESPADGRSADLLAARCQARAALGERLDLALLDCRAALGCDRACSRRSPAGP